MRNTVSEAVLSVQALTTVLRAQADANPDTCQTDEWKALLAGISQLATCTGILATACQTYMKVPLTMEDRLLNKGILPDYYAKELRIALESQPE